MAIFKRYQTMVQIFKGVKAIIRIADKNDYLKIEKILLESNLPIAGIKDPNCKLFALEIEQEIVGTIGYELYGKIALLRSLAVVPSQRGQGRAKELFEFTTKHLKEKNIKTVYGLTLTIPEWLLKLGFKEIKREDISNELFASAELQGACPDSARAFTKSI